VYLKHLTISGFKSFAKKGELEFTAPITAIVGPNGSGKSNVAESFRFVLGEQSLKSMRSKRGEDLIFGGSNAVSRANRATVEVILDNTARVFPVDFDEVVVERTVHRDGQHEYKINSSKARLKDVQELLAAANIGTTGHHIISQGEADRILSASAKERREMIEDALGLKVYQYKKTDAEKKLQKTRENIDQVQLLRKEVVPHMQFLERQIKKMERATELRSELTNQYAEYLKREDVYIAFHHDRLERERLVPQATLAELEAALETAKATLQSHQRDAKSDELLNLEQVLKKIRDTRQQLIRQSGQIEGQMSYLERRIAEAKVTNTKEQDIPVPSGEVKKYIEATEKAIEKAVIATEVALLQRALNDVIHGGRKFLTTVLGKITVSTEVEERELRNLEKEQANILKQIEACEHDETKQTEAYEKLRVSIEAEQSESRAAEREIFRISSEQRTAEHSLSQIESELRVLDRDREEFKRELQEAVTLIGRDVSRYYEFEVVVDGKPVTDKNLVVEDRTVQYERRRQLEKLKIRLEELGGVNQDIEKEYKEVKERDDFLVREITDLEASVEKLEAIIAELTNELNERFVVGIETISVEFKRFFTLMFGGGEATLLRVKPKAKKKSSDEENESESEEIEEEEVVEEGIELDVKLPNKRVRGLDMLSGGERALTSIALIFAMSQVNPPLFIILDETDAALDEANSRRYGDMIEALAEKSQLILITHNRETMSRAGILYGVTMGADGVSKLLSVKFAEAAAVAKA
jgi:chromosome segregation ATPase